MSWGSIYSFFSYLLCFQSSLNYRYFLDSDLCYRGLADQKVLNFFPEISKTYFLSRLFFTLIGVACTLMFYTFDFPLDPYHGPFFIISIVVCICSPIAIVSFHRKNRQELKYVFFFLQITWVFLYSSYVSTMFWTMMSV